jgi:hypothetical protein
MHQIDDFKNIHLSLIIIISCICVVVLPSFFIGLSPALGMEIPTSSNSSQGSDIDRRSVINNQTTTLKASRSIKDNELSPGSSTKVTLSVNSNGASVPAVFESVESSVGNVQILSVTPEPFVQESESGKLVVGWKETATGTVTYKITIPDDADPTRTVVLNGSAESKTEQTEILGPNSIKIVRSSVGPIVGDTPPKDVDQDNLFEDLNGDGNLTITDVYIFFRNWNEPIIQNSVDRFDFSSDGSVTMADVEQLFFEYQGS